MTDPVELDEATATNLETVRLAKLELAKLKEAAESWQAIADQSQDMVEDFLGEHEAGTVNGVTVVTYKHGMRTTVDSKRLRAEIPVEVMAPYLRTKPCRYFNLTEGG